MATTYSDTETGGGYSGRLRAASAFYPGSEIEPDSPTIVEHDSDLTVTRLTRQPTTHTGSTVVDGDSETAGIYTGRVRAAGLFWPSSDLDPEPATIVGYDSDLTLTRVSRESTTHTGETLIDGDSETAGIYSGTLLAPTLRYPGSQIEPEPATIVEHEDTIERPTLSASKRRPSREIDSMAFGTSPETDEIFYVGQFLKPLRLDPVEYIADDVGHGAIIPTSVLTEVEGVVADEDGEPIEGALWLVAADNMPTATTIRDDGSFRLFILMAVYDQFFIVVRPEDPAIPDLVWYEAVEDQTLSPMSEPGTELRFRRTTIEIPEPEAPEFNFQELSGGLNLTQTGMSPIPQFQLRD